MYHRHGFGALASCRPFHLLVLAGLLSACSGRGSNEPRPSSVGDVQIALQVAPGVSLDQVNYSITGNSYAKSGLINLSGSTTLSARIDGIPVGAGYQLTVNGTLGSNGGTCSAAAAFDIARGQTTMVSLSLRCRLTADNGGLQISGQVNVCPAIGSVEVMPAEAFVGRTMALRGTATDVDGKPAALTTVWTSTRGTVSNANKAEATLTCTNEGTGTVTFTVSDGDCSDMLAVPVVCSRAPSSGTPSVHINEVESSGGQPGDWVELVNTGTAAADLSGWTLKDNDDSHVFTIANGTTLADGAYLVIGEPEMTFGLGGGDSVRLFDTSGSLVDSFTWTAHAAVTYGRCPDGSEVFQNTPASTRGSANACASTVDAGAGPDVPPEVGAVDGGAAVVVLEPWPGANAVVETDNLNQFGDNLSGLTYEPGGILWAVLNSPSKIYRMVKSGSVWTFDTSNDWGTGKAIHYPSGTGNPDSEGITKTAWDSPFIYVASERNNDASSVSRLAVLLFDTSATGSELVATHEWNITSDLPATSANLGSEAITWVPDAFLVAGGFIDEKTNAAYVPANYPNHGDGLFFVGIEGTGMVHVYALDHATSGFNRLASITSGHPGVMGLEFDRDAGALWAHCDNTCGNVSNILGISAGKFVVKRIFSKPGTLPDSNNEGLAIAPDSECLGGMKTIFWSDDSHFAGHALRKDTIPCGPLF